VYAHALSCLSKTRVRNRAAPDARRGWDFAKTVGELPEHTTSQMFAPETPSPSRIYPRIIPRLIRAFEPSRRRWAAWPVVLKQMNLA
jgi:hypothetical protein